ncbi:MAG TPA: AMP-binding protein [Nitrospirota bacterium]
MFSPTLVHQYLSRSAARYPNKEALVCGEERWTYARLETASDRIAASLQSIGVSRHDRAIIFLDNSAEAVASLYGVLKAGGTFVILNGGLKAKKLGYIVRDSGASLIITHTDKAQTVAEALQERADDVSIVWAGDQRAASEFFGPRSVPWEALVNGPAAPDGKRGRAGVSIDQDLAALIYTSGSTGEPKGVMSSHANMVSAARSIIQYLENTPDDIILNVLPLSFDYGLYQVIMALMFGGTVVLEKSFAFPVKTLELIKRERVTGFPIVPTIAAYLLRLKNLDCFDLSSLRYLTNTAAALPASYIQRLRSLLPKAKLFSMYGLTECKRVAYLPPEELDRRPLSVGRAIPNCEVMVVDEQGNEVAPGQAGELIVRGSNVMRGYWNAPELTGRVFRTRGIAGHRYLYTGDVFTTDEDGFLFFVGRKDDMIKTKGERVSPREIENTLCELKGVAEAAVIGVPDEILGQAIKVFVVRVPGSDLEVRDVLRHCHESLEPFKTPKHVEFVGNLDKGPNGKVDKKALRSRVVHSGSAER